MTPVIDSYPMLAVFCGSKPLISYLYAQPVLRLNPWLEAGFLLFALAANVTNWRIMRDVNERLPPDQKFSWWWWTFAKHTRLFRRHREIYPESQWRLYFVASFAMALVCMFLLVYAVIPK